MAHLSAERESLVAERLDSRVLRWIGERAREGRVVRRTHDDVAEGVGASLPRATDALRRLADGASLRLSRGRIEVMADRAPVGLP